MGSRSDTSTSSAQSTNVSELNLQDTGGFTVADNSGPTKLSYTNVSTDAGAVNAAIGGITKIAQSGNSAAITLGQTAIDAGAQIANRGLDNAAAAYSSGLTFGTTALETVANLIQDTSLREQQLTSAALSGYQTLAQQNSATDATQIQQIAIYVIVAAVAIVVLPKLLK
jgi:hypothetical protein